MAENKNNPYKGAEFLAYLKCQLFRERFVTAIPEPDIGEDLWVIDSINPGESDDTPLKITRMFQCQVKSAHSPVWEGNKLKHTVNFTKACQVRICSGFFFLIGLRPEQLNSFQVGCLPGEFFKKLDDEGKLRRTKERRIVVDVFTTKEDGDYKFGMRIKYAAKPGNVRGRGPAEDITEFFNHTTLREAFAYADDWAKNQRKEVPGD